MLSARSLVADIDTSALRDPQAWQKWNIARLRPYAFVSAVYIFATWLTRSAFQADTPEYVGSISEHIQGRYVNFWEFGHLFWRPIGWLAFRVFGSVAARFIGSDQRLQITLVLIVVSWLCGSAASLLLLALLRVYDARGWIPQLVATSFIFSNAVLNYSRSGSSYMPGLCLLILSMYLIAREAENPSNNIGSQVCAGLALGGAVSLWFLYILAVPVAIALPFVSGSSNKTRFRLSVGTLFFFCLSITLAYVGVLMHLRLSNAADVMAWARASSHGIEIRGLSRSIFGWSRSFIYMGDAGRTIKRYLLHDPFNPISAWGLIGLWPELLKLGLFYMTLFSIAVGLGHSSRGRMSLTLLTLGTLPVLGFAIYWQGGDLERYLPLYPAFFLLLSLSLVDLKAPHWTKAIGCLFILFVVLTNAVNLRSSVIRDSQTQVESRVNGLIPHLKDESLVVLSNNMDDLVEFSRNFPFSPDNRSDALQLYPLLLAGAPDANWREEFASHALSTWQAGGDIWISRRLLHQAPEENWNWVEGDEKQVSWSDFASFFSRLQYGESVGGDDGFLLLLPSTGNRDSLVPLDSKKSNPLPASVQP